MISDPQWTRMWDLFDAAIERADPAGLGEFLADRCGGDTALQERLEQLLEAHNRATQILSTKANGAERPWAGGGGGRIRFGQFTIRRVIGAGGMGVVYEAQQDHPHRTVALKVLRSGAMSRNLLARFQHEAEVLGSLKHPNIAQIYDAGTIDEGEGAQPYFAMEYIEGRPLVAFANARVLDTRRRVELFIKVCDAVQHAHNRGVIHRDLKPDNILVDESAGTANQAGVPKVLDFGVARATDSDIQTTTLRTEIGQLVGTVQYMSPEQTGGDPNELDTRSDVYSLGVVLFELLSGRLPHDLTDCSIPEAVRVIREENAIRLSSISRDFQGDLETIVHKALEKDPARRYQSASGLADDLQRHLNKEPIVGRPPSRWYVIKRFAQRNKALVVGLSATAAALVIGTVVSTWQAVLATHAEKKATERFQDVRGLSRKVIFDLDAAIAGLPGSTPARRLLVESALTYLDRISEDAGDDPQLIRELAEGYQRLGDVQGHPSKANLGDHDGAIESYRHALQLCTRLAEPGRGIADAPYFLADLRGRLAETLSWQGHHDEGRLLYELTRSQMLALGWADPSDFRAMQAYAGASYGALATLTRLEEPEISGAQKELVNSTSRTIHHTWTAAPKSPREMDTAGSVLLMLAMMHLQVRQPEAALDELAAAEPLLKASAAANDSGMNPVLDYGDVFRHRGSAQQMLNDPGAAAESFRKALALYDDAARRCPGQFAIEHIQCVTSMLLAEAIMDAGDADGALLESEGTVTMLEQRLGEDPANVFRLHSVLEMRAHQAMLLRHIALSESMDASRGLDLLRQARSSLERCQTLADAAINAGTLPEIDIKAAVQFPALIADIDADIKKLESGNTSKPD